MHELSLACALLEQIEAAAAREGFARVRRLNLSAPRLAGVEVEALRFALASLAPGSLLEGAELQIASPDAAAWCEDCERRYALASRADPCPHCGGWRRQIVGGDALCIEDLIVE